MLVHDPEAEAKFLADGNEGINQRQIAWNDFIVVGPGDDPAHARRRGSSRDRGDDRDRRRRRAVFVSRGDRSGTNARSNCGYGSGPGSTRKAAPTRGIADIGGGMGAALNAASGMPGYTISDRGTWLSFKNKEKLTIVIEGDKALINRYDVIELNPATHPNAKLAAAHWLMLWLTTKPGQDAIGAFRVGGEELFPPLRRRAEISALPFEAGALKAYQRRSQP